MRESLKDRGFRFVMRGDEFKWVPPYDLQPTDKDCTDMNDTEFFHFVVDFYPYKLINEQ